MKSRGRNACHTQHRRQGYMLAPLLLVPTCSGLENTPGRGPPHAGGLLKRAALFLPQRPCLLEAHYSFLCSRTNQPIKVVTSPQMSPRSNLPSVSGTGCAAGGPPPGLVDEHGQRGTGKEKLPVCLGRVSDGSQCSGETRTSFSNTDSGSCQLLTLISHGVCEDSLSRMCFHSVGVQDSLRPS